VGREPREGFNFGNDPKLVRTIGNYWPEATTLFDYIKRTMPLSAPGSLSDSDVYSLTAHLLVANEILPAGATLDSASLMAVKMPAHDKFVRDNRKGGAEVK
jgi:cytochrome c